MHDEKAIPNLPHHPFYNACHPEQAYPLESEEQLSVLRSCFRFRIVGEMLVFLRKNCTKTGAQDAGSFEIQRVPGIVTRNYDIAVDGYITTKRNFLTQNPGGFGHFPDAQNIF